MYLVFFKERDPAVVHQRRIGLYRQIEGDVRGELCARKCSHIQSNVSFFCMVGSPPWKSIWIDSKTPRSWVPCTRKSGNMLDSVYTDVLRSLPIFVVVTKVITVRAIDVHSARLFLK